MKDSFTFFPDRSTVISEAEIPSYASETWIETEDGERLQAFLFSHDHQKKPPLIIYFHGNAGNLYYRFDTATRLWRMDYNVLLVSYRGYGKSSGKPTEQGIFQDGAASVEHATHQLGYSEEEIFIFGRSLGSTVAVHIAQGRAFKKVVLITPLTSGREMAVAMGFGFLKFVAGNSYNSLEKINNLQSPLLIIHGDKDSVVPYRMGKALYEAYHGPKQMVTITNAGHNDLQDIDENMYWGEIEKFLSDTGGSF